MTKENNDKKKDGKESILNGRRKQRENVREEGKNWLTNIRNDKTEGTVKNFKTNKLNSQETIWQRKETKTKIRNKFHPIPPKGKKISKSF